MILFFDIETISIYSKDNRIGMINGKEDFTREQTKEERENIEKYREYRNLKEKYEDKLNFMPEFNKILTICVWYKIGDEIRVINIVWSEEEQIKQFFEYSKIYQLSWYNIKWFDIPFIIKRALKYWIEIPNQLKAYWKKPREFDWIIDLQEIYKHIWFAVSNLDILCRFIWITSPKDFWIDWSQVQEFYDNWKEKDIIEYCKRDVEATIKVYDYFKKYNLI